MIQDRWYQLLHCPLRLLFRLRCHLKLHHCPCPCLCRCILLLIRLQLFCLPDPLLKVFFPHSRRAFGAVRHRILQLPLNIIFRRYQAIHWERNNVYGYVLSWGCYVVTQRDPLRHNILDGKSSRLRRIFVRGLVPPLHTVTDFLVEGGFRGQEGLNIAYGCLRPMP